MKYPHTREQTIDLCRRVVPMMAQQRAGLHPLTYTVFYEHLAGLNQPLSEALLERLSEQPLDDPGIIALYEMHIRERQVERLSRMLSGFLNHLVETAQQAGADLTRFRSVLEQRQHELQAPLEQLAVNAVVAALMGETQRMHAVTGELSESLISSINEFSLLKKRLQEAESAAITDPLTRVLNRRGFEQAAAQLARRDAGLTDCWLLFIDVDHFKHINDRFGHALGDQVLAAIADLLRKQVRESDVVGRLGGEEFAVLTPECSLESAYALGERIRTGICGGRIRTSAGDSVASVTVSVGVSRAVAGETLTALLERADKVMYLAKEAGRNRVCVDAAGVVEADRDGP